MTDSAQLKADVKAAALAWRRYRRTLGLRGGPRLVCEHSPGAGAVCSLDEGHEGAHTDGLRVWNEEGKR